MCEGQHRSITAYFNACVAMSVAVFACDSGVSGDVGWVAQAMTSDGWSDTV